MAVEITADMVIHDVVSQYPQTVKVFQSHGLPCTACQIGARESVAGGARTHRLALDLVARRPQPRRQRRGGRGNAARGESSSRQGHSAQCHAGR